MLIYKLLGIFVDLLLYWYCCKIDQNSVLFFLGFKSVTNPRSQLNVFFISHWCNVFVCSFAEILTIWENL